ncbi:uncharacterized protein LOC107042938 [Diachasma alloeum]|uniref:uncharacterized protein LOC107042938 n=1 Tax=Diachasma alloeum TaxID=454923 RepID=UPI0007381FB8|nr:uncharacterized protein LOC107042938 [Diachasma alloeum]
MSAADTALSISVKMAPGPENRQEPVAPDKEQDDGTSGGDGGNTERSDDTAVSVVGGEGVISGNSTIEGGTTGEKQEEPGTFSTLNERELRALLEEAFSYRGSTRDREGKSNLFKELLQEAEVDETEEGRRVVTSTRCIPGSNRRRHKRDSVSERLTHGGSLQNLAQPISFEFDSSFAYLTSGSSHTYGGGRRKGKKHTGPSVSARQREGGSLPSNVNATHSLAPLANLDLLFDKKKSFYEERASYDWTNKEKSKSLDKPTYGCTTKKEDKDKDKKDIKRDTTVASIAVSDIEPDKKCLKVKQTTNEMLESDNPPPDYKPEYMVIDIEVNGLSDRNVVTSGASSGGTQRPHSALDINDDEGTEMKIIEPRRPMQLISRTHFETVQTPVDSGVDYSLREHSGKQDKPKISFNGPEISGTLQLQSYNNVKCVVNGTMSGGQQGKVGSSILPIMHLPAMAVSRAPMQNIGIINKDGTLIDKKSLDENGNAVQGHNGERKKTRRKHTQEPNVIVYKAENVEGHQGNEDIDSLINFIENKESKGKKGKTSGGSTVKVKTSTGAKPRSREKDSKREQLPSKLQKSNSLEEISKTKLEDLTAEKSSSSGSSSVSSQHGSVNGTLRRAKQRSTGDTVADCRGDRRSWGTEEGQSIYCNDIGDEYTSTARRNSNRKINAEIEQEPEFLVVTKKKKSKKQRRSSSGGRAQNLRSSASYLPRPRGFTNEYRTPLSPELRRKSASSMPPSDKSDSSDLDSVHSLPVTSNTKHNMNKNPPSSGTPQASYADIARMATINMSPSSVLNISTMVPNMLNTGTWPSVPGKSPSEPDKFPQDYYPSLDELQQSDRKLRQQNFANSNHVQGFSLSFDKPPSPTSTKAKNASECKKAEAREEAINKKIQVIKYVQEQKNLTANTNHSVHQSEAPVTPKLKNAGNNNSLEETTETSPKDPNANIRITNYQRSNRRNYQQTPPVPQTPVVQMDNVHLKKSPQDDLKKPPTPQLEEPRKHNPVTSDDHQEAKPKQQNPKSFSHSQSESDPQKPIAKIERTSKGPAKEPVVTSQKAEPLKIINNPNQGFKEDEGDTKKPNKIVNKEKEIKSEVPSTRKNPRPAVILMDETSSDQSRNNDSPSELTFGFEVNELLLQSEESEEKVETRQIFVPEPPQIFDKPPPNFDRPPPIFDKHMRYEKFPPNFHVPPPHPHPTMIVPAIPYVGYSQRFHPPANTYIPGPPPATIIEKYHQPKEDFSARYVAPEEAVNVQNYNHDKIVSFVGHAWDAVMREMPVTAATGRVQYYSGQ